MDSCETDHALLKIEVLEEDRARWQKLVERERDNALKDIVVPKQQSAQKPARRR